MDGWDVWLAIFCGSIIAVYGLHELYCYFYPQRRSRWPREQHRSYFSDCRRIKND